MRQREGRRKTGLTECLGCLGLSLRARGAIETDTDEINRV